MQVIGKRCMIDLGRGPGVDQESLELGSKSDVRNADIVVERLNADTIPGKHEHLSARVPDGEREHARETVDKRRSHLFIKAKSDFGIGPGAEDAALRLKLCTQFTEIIGFPIVDDVN